MAADIAIGFAVLPCHERVVRNSAAAQHADRINQVQPNSCMGGVPQKVQQRLGGNVGRQISERLSSKNL